MYQIGQRWFSEAEPELGIGLVSEQTHKHVTLHFPAVNLIRTYSKVHPPIKRVSYKEGDQIALVTGEGEITATVTAVDEQNGIFFYVCGDHTYPEMLLKPDVFFTNPQDKILAGNFDRNNLFELRYQSFLHLRKYQQSKDKGLMGPKVALLPHQLSVTQEVNRRTNVRAMLADEVGLGKTIEAALILNSLIMRGKAQRILILTPDSLINQWFVELYRKFHLSFTLLQTEEDIPKRGEVAPYYLATFGATNQQLLLQFMGRSQWDLVIVDEAHQVSQHNKTNPDVFRLVKHLSAKSPGLLLLTATPEILGQEAHFERLSLLDPVRFNDFESYRQQSAHYQELIPHINALLEGKSSIEQVQSKMKISGENFSDTRSFINFLIDCHGTGRIYFRNTRENLEKHNIHFPRRVLHPHPLSIDGKIDDKVVLEQKAMIIAETMQQHQDQKMLVICHSKELVTKLHKKICELVNAKIAIFHSEQSPLERDRQSAYFADQEGAQLMLCTEVGSEGRNFEFSHHLFLLDIPKVPDQLEQRIGRLDRIGQTRDINIHVPYVQNTFEQILFVFYKDVLRSFEVCPKGAMELYSSVHDELHQLIGAAFDANKLQEFVNMAQEKYQSILQKLSQGHDRLLDLSSFNENLAQETVLNVQNFAKENDLQEYLGQVFDLVGVELNQINQFADYAKPSSNMRLPSYPGLTEDGLQYSFSREYAIKHDNVDFMSWEHPLAQGSVELFVDSELGNVTVVESQKKLPFKLGLECIFRLECVARKNEDINMFFPMTPLRVLIDINGKDYTQEVKMAALKGNLSDVSNEYREQLKQLPKSQINDVVKKAQQLARSRTGKFVSEAQEAIKAHFALEIARLQELQKRNPLVSPDDLEKLKQARDQMLKRVESTQVTIDSIRMIIA